MPRPRCGVTLANIDGVDHYFFNAITRNTLSTDKSIENLERMFEAKEAYKTLPPVIWTDATLKKNSLLARKEALQAWIDIYITPEKWQRCLLTLRQHKSKKKLKLQRLDLKAEVYDLIKELAAMLNLTMGETLYNLVKPRLEKLQKKELAQV